MLAGLKIRKLTGWGFSALKLQQIVVLFERENEKVELLM
jgi:hypothetical protein